MQSIGYHIRSIYLNYLRHLSQGGKRPALPPYVHREGGTDKISASSLGRCPLAEAYKRNRNQEKTNPMTDGEEMSSLHLMQQGTRDAEPLQEAFVWSGGQVEVPVESDLLRGRVDALIEYEEEHHVVELKRRDSKDGGHPKPKMSDILQCLAYSSMLGVPMVNVHIVTLNRYGINVWNFEPVSSEGVFVGFLVVNEDGKYWTSPLNNPEKINEKALTEEVMKHRDYLMGVQTACPMVDFLNHPEGWLCYHDLQEPKHYKTENNAIKFQGEGNYVPVGKGFSSLGTVRPRCEWFDACHGSHEGIHSVLDDQGVKSEYDPSAI